MDAHVLAISTLSHLLPIGFCFAAAGGKEASQLVLMIHVGVRFPRGCPCGRVNRFRTALHGQFRVFFFFVFRYCHLVQVVVVLGSVASSKLLRPGSPIRKNKNYAKENTGSLLLSIAI